MLSSNTPTAKSQEGNVKNVNIDVVDETQSGGGGGGQSPTPDDSPRRKARLSDHGQEGANQRGDTSIGSIGPSLNDGGGGADVIVRHAQSPPSEGQPPAQPRSPRLWAHLSDLNEEQINQRGANSTGFGYSPEVGGNGGSAEIQTVVELGQFPPVNGPAPAQGHFPRVSVRANPNPDQIDQLGDTPADFNDLEGLAHKTDLYSTPLSESSDIEGDGVQQSTSSTSYQLPPSPQPPPPPKHSIIRLDKNFIENRENSLRLVLTDLLDSKNYKHSMSSNIKWEMLIGNAGIITTNSSKNMISNVVAVVTDSQSNHGGESEVLDKLYDGKSQNSVEGGEGSVSSPTAATVKSPKTKKAALAAFGGIISPFTNKKVHPADNSATSNSEKNDSVNNSVGKPPIKKTKPPTKDNNKTMATLSGQATTIVHK